MLVVVRGEAGQSVLSPSFPPWQLREYGDKKRILRKLQERKKERFRKIKSK
jgi:hypothetical protein